MPRSGSRSRSRCCCRCRCALANMISRLRLKWQFLVLLYSVFSILDIVLVVDTCSCCVSAVSPILRRLFCSIVFPSSSYVRSRKDTKSPTYVYRCIYISGVLSSYATGTDARSGCTHSPTYAQLENLCM